MCIPWLFQLIADNKIFLSVSCSVTSQSCFDNMWIWCNFNGNSILWQRPSNKCITSMLCLQNNNVYLYIGGPLLRVCSHWASNSASKWIQCFFYVIIHTAWRETSKELIADANLRAQCEWPLGCKFSKFFYKMRKINYVNLPILFVQ